MEEIIKNILVKGKKQELKDVNRDIVKIEDSIKSLQKLLEEKIEAQEILINQLEKHSK